MKKKSSNLILVLIFLAGLSLLLYPTVSDLINSMHQSYAIAQYDQVLDGVGAREQQEQLELARAYNAQLSERPFAGTLDREQQERYNSLLDPGGNGIMAYVDIPCIDCRLPIYHGTDEAVLQVAVGHLEWSSLPVGGPGTHSVISGHRGLPSAELMTHIDRLTLGDAFYIHVLGQRLKYRVDDIAVVLPDDTSRLRVVAGKDYVTLVTCTPYGVNSHRLLVRGERVEEELDQGGRLPVTNEIKRIHPGYIIPIVLVSVLALAVAALVLVRRLRRGRTRGKRERGKERRP